MSLLYFTAKWCGPCKVLGPILDKAIKDLPLNLIKIDADNDPHEYFRRYGVNSMPTLIYVRDREQIIINERDERGLRRKLQDMCLFH